MELEPPPDAVYEALDFAKDDYVSLEATLDRLKTAGIRLVEMVSADQFGWERYEAPQWQAIDDFLSSIPDDPEAAALSDWASKNRSAYFKYGRRYLGWAVFVLRPTDQ
jgi:hypothetical protein